jgi:hypothetical protein
MRFWGPIRPVSIAAAVAIEPLASTAAANASARRLLLPVERTTIRVEDIRAWRTRSQLPDGEFRRDQAAYGRRAEMFRRT